MAHTYEYAVLTAVPNPRRGERVNVGIVVFRHDKIDVRFRQAAYKLRALTGEAWDSRLESASACLTDLFSSSGKAAEALETFGMLEPLLKPSSLGWLSAETDHEYEQRVDQILRALVGLPKKERIDSKSRMNTEIAREFKKHNVLAGKDEAIENGKIVRDFPIDEQEGLAADFARKNGSFYIASTLDLRKQSVNLGEAALKSIVLDKAGRKFGDKIRKVGVFAVDRDMLDSFKSHIDLLGDYADDLYDWLDLDSRKRFQRSLYDAAAREANGLI
jgi:hypothetical protein